MRNWCSLSVFDHQQSDEPWGAFAAAVIDDPPQVDQPPPLSCLIRLMAAAAVAAAALTFATPLVEARGARPVEVPRVEVKPKTLEEIRQDQAAAARARADEVARAQQARDLAIRTFPDFNGKDVTYSVFDGPPDGETRTALRSYLDADATATKIAMKSWKLTSQPRLQDVADMLRLAASPLPGKVELGMLLDPKVFGDAYRSIVEAWGTRPTTQTPTNGLMSDYLSSLKGNTLIVVGHVEDGNYVYESPDGTKVAVDIKQLLIDAHNNGVLIVPIGCSTAEAGVGIGFVGEIGTGAVAGFLRGLPRDDPAVSDVIHGMLGIGEVRVDIRDAANLFQIQVYPKDASEPITRIRVPYAGLQLPSVLPTANGLATSATATAPTISYQLLPQIVAQSADDARPPWRKAWFVALVTNPLIYVTLWAVVFVMSVLGTAVMRPWIFQHREWQRAYQLVRFPLVFTIGGLGALLIGGSIALIGWIGYGWFDIPGAAVAGGITALEWYVQLAKKPKRAAALTLLGFWALASTAAAGWIAYLVFGPLAAIVAIGLAAGAWYMRITKKPDEAGETVG